MHTYQGPLDQPPAKYAVVEAGTKCPLEFTGLTTMGTCSIPGGTCSACPNVTLDGYNYNGKNWCGTLEVTSSWNGAWGSTPAGWVDGDPVAPNGCLNDATGVRYWGQHLEVGDWITSNNEWARIIAKSGNTLTLIRGWGGYYDQGVWGPKSHTNGDTWYTACGAYRKNPEARVDLYLPGGVAWWPTYDPTGTNPSYTYYDDYQNHALHTGTLALRPEYPVVRFTKDSPASLAAPTYGEIELPRKFAGTAIGDCSGNSCEKHPAYGQVAGDANSQTWMADLHPRLSHPNSSGAVSLVAGKTNIWKWQSPFALNPKIFDLEAYTAFWPFRRVDTLTDSTTETGKRCTTIVAGDCFAGSAANSTYFVNEAFDTTFVSTTANTCRVAEFGSLNGDACFGNTGGISASITQWRLPRAGERYRNASGMRVLSKWANAYRESATGNVKVDPLGKVLFARGNWYLWLPPFVSETSRSGETYTSHTVTVGGVPAGTSTALVEFGYNASFQCNRSRDNSCLAESTTLNETTPYRFDHETLTGVSCGSGCTITIPALRNRTLYWRWKFRNAGGTVIHTGQTQVVAVN